MGKKKLGLKRGEKQAKRRLVSGVCDSTGKQVLTVAKVDLKENHSGERRSVALADFPLRF